MNNRKEFIPDYKRCYEELKEALALPHIEKTIRFAAAHPGAVYKFCTLEYDSIRHGFIPCI
ncbi:MAG: hypothetical protein JEZ11_22025 [Desulfobacterales bacterium]|nr:hypothetical protein [Desulfobacterales bacterium]